MEGRLNWIWAEMSIVGHSKLASLHFHADNALACRRPLLRLILTISNDGNQPRRTDKLSKKAPKKIVKRASTAPTRPDFDHVLGLIDAARTRAVAAVNTTLIDLYWSIGEHIVKKIADERWGQGTVQALAAYIQQHQPNARGFSSQNLWRMRQFYETYRGQSKLSALLRELPWTHNLLIMSRSKREEEREFYLRLAHDQKWASRELERQLNGALFERVVLSPVKLSSPVRELHPAAASVFKDS